MRVLTIPFPTIELHSWRSDPVSPTSTTHHTTSLRHTLLSALLLLLPPPNTHAQPRISRRHRYRTMSDTKEFTYSDVSEHTSKKDLYLVIHDKVYNSSSFVDEHPYV